MPQWSGIGGQIGGAIGGPWGAIAGSIGGALLDDDAAQEGIDQQNAWNANQAQMNRDFQKEMRATQWQTSVADMKAAGINPMVAYGSGGAGNLSGATAAPSGNKQQAQMATAAQTAQIVNMSAQTELLKAQERKVEAEIPQITTSTANVAQQTVNLEKTLEKMQQEIHNINQNTNLQFQQQLTEGQKFHLVKAQTEVQDIEKELKASQITNTEAQTRMLAVQQKLRELEIPGAKNQASFETNIGEAARYGGAAGRGAQMGNAILNSARKVFGK